MRAVVGGPAEAVGRAGRRRRRGDVHRGRGRHAGRLAERDAAAQHDDEQAGRAAGEGHRLGCGRHAVAAVYGRAPATAQDVRRAVGRVHRSGERLSGAHP